MKGVIEGVTDLGSDWKRKCGGCGVLGWCGVVCACVCVCGGGE